MPDRHLVDAHIVLVREDRVLLSKRRGDAFDGRWHLPAGKVDAGEDVLSAAVREAWEEVGVRIDPVDLAHVHTVHITGPGQEPRFGLFFRTTRWTGEPSNREPAKCHGLDWFEVDALPEPMIGYAALGIRALRTGVPFSIHGWS
ncbi:NUDIX domain-containing protein [Saccharopolyspora sp. NFXS83]|uniref:NUDIX hydrolase n=1 Tax=Saccharopolyspora sp. NFXS83 TaxID=2993560 RepID=UPI00224A8886|nr:NUDIX domain-containing protein [Saccharopolyspora sp. NFXS83]MCX2732402.1 NUDIX domain-containing protein [Saccharopolyspora sp. NFXS83]